jgi:hypothetical protein
VEGPGRDTPNRPFDPRGTEPSRTDASLVPAGDDPTGVTEKAPRYLLKWRIAGGTRPSRLEAELSVHALDPERVELHIEGTFDHEEQRAPEAAELERRAKATVRAFLRRLAHTLEGDPEVRRPA